LTVSLKRPGAGPSVLAAIISFAAAFGAAALGGLATSSSVDGWYVLLNKPAFNPPNWVFAPVWTVLYTLMAVAAWRVWRHSTGQARRAALAIYAVQLMLNLAWSVIFFGVRQPGAAFAIILALLTAIGLTGRAFRRIDRVSALMLVPYGVWVTFAAILNFEIWRLN
jgi:tryptophan-rich sensory protein